MQLTQSSELAQGSFRQSAWMKHGRFTSAVIASIAAAVLTCSTESARAQQLEHSMRQPWSLYIFVSTGMPHQSLVALAREAVLVNGANIVFRGFPGSTFDLQGEQRLIAQLNQECCGVTPDVTSPRSSTPSTRQHVAQPPRVPAWSIDPALFRRFDVSVVPTFVLAETGNAGDQTFTKVSGDMALANALKFFAQGSSSPARRQAAATIYQAAYGGRQ